MRMVFFGTPAYVISILDALHKTFKSRSGESPIAAIITQPPKPTGRKQQLEYSPVDNWAHKKKIPIFFDPQDIIKNKIQADIGILASYGQVIKREVIDYFPHGILNIHSSLLPELRGAAPIPATLVMGKKEAGVTIFSLDELLDHGPIISQFTEEILPEDTTATLMIRLFERSAEVLTTLIPAYLHGKITAHEQDHSKATYTREITKEDAFVDPVGLKAAIEGRTFQKTWKMDFIKDFTNHYSPITIHQFIRAMQPWPGAWTKVKLSTDNEAKRLRILKAHVESVRDGSQTIRDFRENKLVLDTVQLEAKNPVSWKQFLEGHPNFSF